MIKFSFHNRFVVFIDNLVRVGGSAGELIVAQDVAQDVVQHVAQHSKQTKSKNPIIQKSNNPKIQKSKNICTTRKNLDGGSGEIFGFLDLYYFIYNIICPPSQDWYRHLES